MIDISYLDDYDHGWGYLKPNQDVLDMMLEIKERFSPSNFLEIGFYMGHSTSMWAKVLGQECNIVSCAPPHPRACHYAPLVEKHTPNVTVHLVPSPSVYENIRDVKFDVAFIDGSHDQNSVKMDIEMCIKLGIKTLLFDNYERTTVREGISYVMDRKPDQVWPYYADHKGVVQTNEVALFCLTNSDHCDIMSS